MGQCWRWAQHPQRRGIAIAATPIHLVLAAIAWFRFGEGAFWWFVGAWWAVWLTAWVLLFQRARHRDRDDPRGPEPDRRGRGVPVPATAGAMVVFALVALPGAVAPDRYLAVVGGALALGAWVAALLVVGERRRLRTLPPPPEQVAP